MAPFHPSPITVLTAALLALATTGCFHDKQAHAHPMDPPIDAFPRGVEGLDPAQATPSLDYKDGDTLYLTAHPVRKSINGRDVRMLAYNGSVPGPTIRVPQGATITIVLKNQTGSATSLHSHGVRLASLSDGAVPVSQIAIPEGGSFTYTVRFPDPGLFWYHGHVREDYSQEMGLYGNYHVIATDTTFWDPVDREVVLMLDDILLDSGGVAPFRKEQADHAMMGRYGNTFLTNGDTDYVLEIKRHEVVRFLATNACNTRVFYLGIETWGGAGKAPLLKVVGTDNGRYEKPFLTYYDLLSPGERMIFETFFDGPGEYHIVHRTPLDTFSLGRIRVLDDTVPGDLWSKFFLDDTSAQAIASIDSFRTDFDRPPDKNVILTVRMGGTKHPMKSAAGGPEQAEAAEGQPPLAKQGVTQHGDPTLKGVEWYDHMNPINKKTLSEGITWIIRDTVTGKENLDIDWRFNQGDRVMIRVFNDSASMHPMPHPIHFHGQRFLVVNVDGQRNYWQAWKDTYLVGRGETVDLLLDASNPGAWMGHCHISEHMEAMMMFNFKVE